MTIETYAKQIGITATAEQLEKLQEYMQHKPKVGDVYLMPMKVRRVKDNGDISTDLADGCGIILSERYFTPDHLACNHQQGLINKFKVGQKVKTPGRVRKIASIGVYYMFEGDDIIKLTEDQIEATEDEKC